MDHILAILALSLQALGLLAGLVWYLLRGAKGLGSFESTFETRLQHLKEENDELNRTVATNRTIQENDYRELRSLYERLLEKIGERA